MPLAPLGSSWSAAAQAREPLAWQRVAEWSPPRWTDPAYPQQWHLDIRVRDAGYELAARHFPTEVPCELDAVNGPGMRPGTEQRRWPGFCRVH
jgi:hypothetical protein